LVTGFNYSFGFKFLPMFFLLSASLKLIVYQHRWINVLSIGAFVDENFILLLLN